MTARITVNGRPMQADVSGALFQPDAGALIVADLHLEKGSHFARRGQFLPPYDTRATLEKLARVIRRFRPRRVVCLGDSFHDAEAGQRIAATDHEALLRLVGTQPWTWVLGNHDPAIPDDVGGERAARVEIEGLVLRHEPGPAPAFGEICGHLHPKATVAARGQRITAACFVSDGNRLVMPAFGAYAGGLDALDPAIAGLFGRAGFRALLLGSERLHLVGKAQLERRAGG
ncbi:MAG: ligase-associated DNA damage response endonuclease PdeM [Alphaproteobacteria bacterium]|nr:ligase-associated DNA damage response endonuclease PdeM [Alphaproteobacteria bacterium]